jgi:hypothetical protein
VGQFWHRQNEKGDFGTVITEDSLLDRPVYGRTFNTAMWIVGLIAAIQFVALIFGVMRRSADQRETELVAREFPAPAVAPSPAAVQTVPPQSSQPAASDMILPVNPLGSGLVEGVDPATPAVAPAPQPPVVSQDLPPAIRGIGGPTNPAGTVPTPVLSEPSFTPIATEADSSTLSAALARAARENVLTGDPILERLMSTGAELRASGNMQGALKAFREVESALPDHPRVLAEFAATLSQMGLTEKANSYWERVETLGPVGAGDYFPLAGQQLRGESPIPVVATGKILKIGEVKVEEQAPTSDGQKVSLRITVDADSASRPVVDDMTLVVNFYDQLSDGTIKPTTADTGYDYPSKPYDWQTDGTEEIVVTYNQPVFTEEQKRELGERRYYGYVIEVYYQDQFQDTVAMPEAMSVLRMVPIEDEKSPSETLAPQNALFPPPAFP